MSLLLLMLIRGIPQYIYRTNNGLKGNNFGHWKVKLIAHSQCTGPGQGQGQGQGQGPGNDGSLYYTMYCTHYTGTGTVNHCFLL